MLLTVDDDFDLDRIADSGQCFRWEPFDGDTYRIVHREFCLYISQRSDGKFLLECEEEEYRSVWHNYFDLDTDYRSIRSRIEKSADPFLYAASESEKGIRILRQDPWEIAVTFIISQNRNIPTIKRSVATLCRLAGAEHMDRKGRAYYSFPRPEAVLAMSAQAIAECRLGYRDKYILAAAKAAVDGVFSPESLGMLPDEKLIGTLCSLYGIGPKVATCIALYGFHRTDAFPVDTWIRKAMKNEYPDGFPFQRFRPYNGVLQQYIFAYYRNKGAQMQY